MWAWWHRRQCARGRHRIHIRLDPSVCKVKTGLAFERYCVRVDCGKTFGRWA